MFKKCLVAFLCIGVSVGSLVVAGRFPSVHETSSQLGEGTTPSISIVTTGDTAQVMFFELSHITQSAGDSVIYMDTFVVGSAGFDSIAAKFVSPVMSMTFWLAPNVSDSTLLDTVGIGVVGCTVVFAAQQLGIQYDLSEGADAKLTTAIDSLVDTFNKRTNLKDSVLAHDSVTYMKLISKFSQHTIGRWTMKFTTDSTDSSSNFTTEAEVMAGMVATINDEADIATYLFAEEAGDTGFWVTSNDPGLAFLVYIGDTAIDTTHTQLNVVSDSRSDDTLFLFNLLAQDRAVIGLNGWIILDTPQTMLQGVGKDDSAYIILYGGQYVRGNLVLTEVARDSNNKLPCSLYISKPVVSGSDTLLREQLWVEYIIIDSASDSTFTVPCSLYIDLLLIND